METQAPSFKKKTFIAWLTFVAVALTLYFINRERFEIEAVRAVVFEHRLLVIPLYLLLLSVQGIGMFMAFTLKKRLK